MPVDEGKEFFSIGEVCEITGLESHVLRYWESVFPELSPPKNNAGRRIYREKDINTVLDIKNLLYEQKYTIEGAKLALERQLSPPEKKGKLQDIAEYENLIRGIKKDIREILRLLD